MAKIAEMQEVSLEKLKPYERNAKQHSPEQVEKIAESIKEFGFLSPCLIDREYNIIAGHGRVMAARKAGLEAVPCVFAEGLSEAQRKAYILADNRLTELGEWDMEIVTGELAVLHDMAFDINLAGFEIDERWFDRAEKDGAARQEGNDEYNEFLEKFEPKKTTDDCYTPELIYESVANYVAETYKIDRAKMVRPFRPGGDYQAEAYKPGEVVVDNPPFSILSEIIRFYDERRVPFFLFAPGLTTLSRAADEAFASVLFCGVGITYENGANVCTSFVTSLEPEEVKAKTAPELFKAVEAANDEVLKQMHTTQRKYSYPDNVITSAMGNRYAKYGIELSVKRSDAVRISELDEQKKAGDAIFGGGYLLSERAAAERAAAERAAAERAAAERWTLSERELEIIKNLGGDDNGK